MAANAWKNEPDEVKQEYINLSDDTKARYNEGPFSQSQDSSSIVENANVMTDVHDVDSLNYAYSFPGFAPENTLNFDSSFNNNHISIENDNTKIGNNFIASEYLLVDELKDRIRILEI